MAAIASGTPLAGGLLKGQQVLTNFDMIAAAGAPNKEFLFSRDENTFAPTRR